MVLGARDLGRTCGIEVDGKLRQFSIFDCRFREVFLTVHLGFLVYDQPQGILNSS